MKLALPCAVLPTQAREEAARRLGLELDQVARIAHGGLALRDGQVMDETRFYDAFPDDDYWSFTGADVLPPDLVIHEVEVSRDPHQPLSPPISPAEVVAVDVVAIARYLEQMTTLDAPSIMLGHARSLVQGACEDEPRENQWEPLGQLMTGRAAEPGSAGEPRTMFGVPMGSESRETAPCDCSFLERGFLIQYQFASIILSGDGAILDVFPSRGLRPVGSDQRHVLLVCGGGGTASSGYFGARAYVRDLVEHRWLRGAIPASLPRFVAGTIGDVRWSVVVDAFEGVGYRMAPRWLGDLCGNTFNSACGRYAWDGTHFVLDASTGAAVLDARTLQGELVSFARASDGWRFLMLEEPEEEQWEQPSTWRILDQRGECVRELGDHDYESAAALSADGLRLLHVTKDALQVSDADSGRSHGRAIDLRPLQPVLELPDDVALWQRLAAAYAVPAALAGVTPAEAGEAIEDCWGDEPSEKELIAAIEGARDREKLPKTLPLVGRLTR